MWVRVPTQPQLPYGLHRSALGKGKERVQYLPPVNPNEPERSLPFWRRWWDEAAWVLFMFAISRLVVIMLIWLSRHIVERGPYVTLSGQMQHGGTLRDLLTQWDGFWYRFIAEHGYGPPSPDLAAAFFPVYPMLVRGVAFVVRDLQIASLIVSNGCLIAAALLFMRLLRLDYEELICRRAVTFLMFNPVSFFLSAAYTESTFLLLSIGALLAARQGKWLVAGLCGGCLSATRAPGLVIGAPLVAEYVLQWRGRGAELRAFFRPHLLWLGLLPAGLLLYMLYLYFLRGDFFLPMHAQARGWEKTLSFPWKTFLWPTTSFPPSHVPLYQAIVAAALILTAAGFFLKLRATYLVYAVVALLFYLAWGSLEGLPRYVSILFPIHIILAMLSSRWPWMYEPLLAFSIALLGLGTVLFANAYHMT